MEIKVKKRAQKVVLALSGSLDIHSSLDFKTALEEHVSEESPEVIIEMGKVVYLDSSGIGILIKALNHVQGVQGKLSVANLQPAIEKIFKVSGLTSYFDILSPEDFQARIAK